MPIVADPTLSPPYYYLLHRPLHKQICKEPSAAANFKLLGSFISNEYLMFQLKKACVLAYQLHEEPITVDPLISRCDLAIDVANLSTIGQLLSRTNSPSDFPDGVQGMLQVKSFVPLNSNVAIDTGRRQLWEDSRRNTPDRVVLIDFNMEGTSQVSTIALNICKAAIFEVMLKQPLSRVSSVTGIKEDIPLSLDSCLKFIFRLFQNGYTQLIFVFIQCYQCSYPR